MLNGLTVDLGGWDIDNYQLLYNINVKNCSFNGVTDEKVRRTGKSHDIHFDNLLINGEQIH